MVVQYERGMAYHTPPKKLPQSHLRLRFALGDLFIKSTGPLIQPPQPGEHHSPNLIRPQDEATGIRRPL